MREGKLLPCAHHSVSLVHSLPFFLGYCTASLVLAKLPYLLVLTVHSLPVLPVSHTCGKHGLLGYRGTIFLIQTGHLPGWRIWGPTRPGQSVQHVQHVAMHAGLITQVCCEQMQTCVSTAEKRATHEELLTLRVRRQPAEERKTAGPHSMPRAILCVAAMISMPCTRSQWQGICMHCHCNRFAVGNGPPAWPKPGLHSHWQPLAVGTPQHIAVAAAGSVGPSGRARQQQIGFG